MNLRLRKTTTATAALTSHSALPQAKNGVFVPCKQRKLENSNIYLPREVIFNILLLLPAKLLREVVTYVCKQWCDVVSDPCFIRAHCQMPNYTTTSASFIIQGRSKRHEVYCIDQDTAKSAKVTSIQLPFPAMIQGSHNGLVLFCDTRDILKVHLMNPLTKLMVSLPPVVSVKLLKPSSTAYSFAINSSGQYKVVHFSLYYNHVGCELNVFTIGVDKAWRRIHLQHSPGILMNHLTTFIPFRTRGLVIAGFVHWCTSVSFSLAMDVDTETFYRISWPAGVNGHFQRYFINMGTALGLMTLDDFNRPSIWTVWKLTDVKSSEWTKITTIDFKAIVTKVSNGKWTFATRVIKPFGMIDGELWFRDPVGSEYFLMIRYDLANDSFVSFRVDVPPNSVSVFRYLPTLISPKTPST